MKGANTKETRSSRHYIQRVNDLLGKDSGTVEKAILPTVFDIYSYPHPHKNLLSTKGRGNAQ